ncbi:MAG: MFS transporter [Clostridiales bacterium]|nr:MFS transporter [Clostridiales bacterium]
MATKALKTELSAEDRQFNRNKWLFSVSGIGRDMSYQLIASFLLTYIQFGMTLTIAQFTTISLLIGIAGRIWDAINDPMMGAIIEGTHMKFGKFRPWILIGALLTGTIIILMFNIQTVFTGWGFVVYMVIMYLLWESAFTMNDIGYWSMLASLSSKKEQRNSATMLTVVFAGLGAFIGQGGISFLYPGNVLQAFRWISIGIAVIFMAMQVVMVVFIRERPRSLMEVNEKVSFRQMWQTIRKNDQILWMTLSMLFYNIGSSLLVGLAYNLYYLEIGYDGNAIVFIAIFGVFNILAQVFYPKLANWLGRRKLQIVSIIVACVGYLGIALIGWTSILPFNLITLSIFGILVFVGQALFYMASIINMTNCVEYNEYKRGERNEAVVSTLRPLMAKFADAMKYGIITLVLIVSAVYGLSQNISTVEAQKGYFDRMTVAEQVEYLDAVNRYLHMYDDVVMEDPETGEVQVTTTCMVNFDELNERLSNDPVLKGRQISAEYLFAIGDVAIMEKTEDGNIFVAFVNDYKSGDLVEGKTYIFLLSGEIDGVAFNVANIHFKEQSTMSMRLWIRAAVTVVPMLFLFAALIIQHKKFVIDEKYYDMMMEEINSRKAATEDTDSN